MVSENLLPLSADGVPVLLTVAEAAACLRVNRSTMYDLMATGELPSLKVGRRRLFRASDLAVFVEERTHHVYVPPRVPTDGDEPAEPGGVLRGRIFALSPDERKAALRSLRARARGSAAPPAP